MGKNKDDSKDEVKDEKIVEENPVEESDVEKTEEKDEEIISEKVVEEPVNIGEHKFTKIIGSDDDEVKIFTKAEIVGIDGLKNMSIHNRYNIKKSDIEKLPKNSYVLA